MIPASSGRLPIAAFRFIHTADIHLDSPLKSLALRDPALAELVGDATRQAFTRIIDLALEEAVDALLIAGDLYDGDQTSMKTARFIGEQLKRLSDAGIRAFIIRGNHDHLARITRELTFPGGVTAFGGRAGIETIERAGRTPIAIHGLSFTSAEAPESLLPKYGRPVPDAVNIGLMHTSLGGSAGHSVYAPCSLADLQASGFRYWALGHIHKRSVFAGDVTVVMPGMPQGRDINEAGAKSITLVTLADDGAMTLEERIVGSAVFARAEVDLTGVDEWREAVRSAGRVLAETRKASAAPHLVARLALAGVTPLGWRLRRDLDLMRLEIERDIVGAGGLWLEKLEVALREGEGLQHSSGPLAELAGIASADVLTSDGFRMASAAFAEDFVRNHLPRELRGLLGGDDAETAAAVSALAEEGIADVLARLSGDDSAGPA
jgi:DNA repair protein SbcD/Mre11